MEAADADEIRLKLLESVVAQCAESYKEGARITGVLDDKAQKAAGTAGLFLGAGFALMKPGGENVAKYIGLPGVLVMAATILLLMVTIGSALIANWLRRIPAPLNPAQGYGMAMRVVTLGDNEPLRERRISHLNDISGLWLQILGGQQGVNESKGRLVKVSQISLGLAMVFVGVLLILVLAMEVGHG